MERQTSEKSIWKQKYHAYAPSSLRRSIWGCTTAKPVHARPIPGCSTPPHESPLPVFYTRVRTTPHAAHSLNRMGWVYVAKGRLKLAEEMFARSLKAYEQVRPPMHPPATSDLSCDRQCLGDRHPVCSGILQSLVWLKTSKVKHMLDVHVSTERLSCTLNKRLCKIPSPFSVQSLAPF